MAFENISIRVDATWFPGKGFNRSQTVNEAVELSRRLGIPVVLWYHEQYRQDIMPDITDEQIEQIKVERFVIGV